jgi:hypothetical protein
MAAALVAAPLVVQAVYPESGEETPGVATEAARPPAELPRLLASWVPEGFELANTMTETPGAEGRVVLGTAGDQSRPVVVPEGPPGTIAGASYTAYYGPPAPGPLGLPWIQLTTSSSATSALPASTAEHVTVRGRRAQLVSTPASESVLASITLHWQEARGVFVTLSAINTELTTHDLVGMADGLVQVSRGEWNAASNLPNPAEDAIVEALTPHDALGSVVVSSMGEAAYLASDGQVCAFHVDGRGQGPVSCADAGTRVNVLGDRIGFPTLLFGVMPNGATDIVATSGGTGVDGARDGVEIPQSVFLASTSDGATIYAINVGVIPDSIAFIGADGEPVEATSLDIKSDL